MKELLGIRLVSAIRVRQLLVMGSVGKKIHIMHHQKLQLPIQKSRSCEYAHIVQKLNWGFFVHSQFM